jgi:hypothetical protein
MAYQPSEVGSDAGSSIYGGSPTAMVETPDDISLDEFKNQVKMWMQIDSEIKQINIHIKEKRKVQRMLTERILAFMSRYNIEDLNTKEGKLRYKTTYVQPNVKKTDVKKKLLEVAGEDVVKAVFDTSTTPKIEKVTLRRLKGVRVMNV